MSDSDFSFFQSSGSSDEEKSVEDEKQVVDKQTRKPYTKEKTLRKPCSVSCILGCTKQINESQRHQILKYFHGLGDINLRRLFVQKSVQRVITGSGSNQQHTFEFYFTINGKRVQICRLFFLSTLSIQIGFVIRSLDMIFDDQVQQNNKRKSVDSKKDDEALKKSISLKKDEGILNHIKSVPRVVSCAYENGKPVYTEFYIKLDTMYTFYGKYCKTNSYPKAPFQRYKEIFDEQNKVFRKCEESFPLLEENDVTVITLNP